MSHVCETKVPAFDSVGGAVINELTFVCASDTPRSSALRCLSRAVDEFVASCMQLLPDDDREFIIIELVSTVPLIFGYDFLFRLGADYGLVRGSGAKRLDSEKRHVADGTAIKHAIDVWRQRATRAIESGYVVEEGDLFLFLDGLARLGVGATVADALEALGEFCARVPGGFAYFLQQARLLRVEGIR